MSNILISIGKNIFSGRPLFFNVIYIKSVSTLQSRMKSDIKMNFHSGIENGYTPFRWTRLNIIAYISSLFILHNASCLTLRSHHLGSTAACQPQKQRIFVQNPCAPIRLSGVYRFPHFIRVSAENSEHFHYLVQVQRFYNQSVRLQCYILTNTECKTVALRRSMFPSKSPDVKCCFFSKIFKF
jgi:hypothetical protein